MPEAHSTDEARLARERRTIARALRVFERRSKYGRQQLTGVSEARDYLRIRLDGLEREEFWAVWLDRQQGVIAAEMLFYGTVDQTAVYPREVVKAALDRNASAVILAHNHPSGAMEPSAADIALTKEIARALKVVDVAVKDHFIVGSGPVPTSLFELGLI